MSQPKYLAQLNESQREAVVSPARSLQILAGPGSGKTRVLITRVAWLVKENNLRPSSVVVVTFTRKAAREMAERLEQPHVLGLPRSGYLRMGTFHAFCSGLLRRHINLTSLKQNFVVADENKSKHILDATVKELRDLMLSCNRNRKSAEFRKAINDAKCKGTDHHTYLGRYGNDMMKKDIAMVYRAYEEKLEQANMIDFNGILLKARDLIKQHPHIVEFVSHVLVDEFQDTNGLQYELLLLLTRRGEKAMTIVGDPDQSIFGWRFADKKNFDNMINDYKGTVVVNLERNYRSTKAILSNATSVVSLDKKRETREFYTDNHAGIPISALHTDSEVDEANAVAEEIKRIIKYSNGLVNYKDIAILFRMNHLTLNFEQALLRARVPFVLVSGTRFLDRMEVRDILAYLSFFYNPMDTEAFTRIINAPKRGLGDVSVKKILSLATAKNWTLIETLQHLVNRHPATFSIRISGKTRSSLQSILTLHLEIEEKMQRMESPANLLSWIVDATDYYGYLETSFEKDHENREKNVKELIDFAHRQTEGLLDAENIIDPVGQFLESVTLCGDAKEHDDAKEGKVSLITIHGSKGLEWTTVFVAGCEEGIVPMTHTENPDEEIRLMYVAMTRAKCFLYCTTASRRRQYGMTSNTELSRFFAALPSDGYQTRTPVWNTEVRYWVAKMLRVSYTEDDTLQLEDDGSEYNRIFSSYDEFTCGDYDHYGHDDYDDYDYNSYDGSDHFRDYSSHSGRSRRSRYTNASRSTINLPGITSASSLLQQLLLPAPSSELAKKRKQEAKLSSIKSEHGTIQQQKQLLGDSTIKSESKTKTTLHHLFQRQTSDQKLKLEPTLTTVDTMTQKQEHTVVKLEPYTTSNQPEISKLKKRKRNTHTITSMSLDQCVVKGLQQAGTGKSSFTIEEAISAVETQVEKNQINAASANKIKEQVDEQLGMLVQKGALMKMDKAGVSRFYVAE